MGASAATASVSQCSRFILCLLLSTALLLTPTLLATAVWSSTCGCDDGHIFGQTKAPPVGGPVGLWGLGWIRRCRGCEPRSRRGTGRQRKHPERTRTLHRRPRTSSVRG